MTMTYDEAVAIQRRHEDRIMSLSGVTGVGAKLRDGRPVLEVTVDPQAEIPPELHVEQVDGLPLVVEKRRYELH